MFVCACALFGFVGNASAQLSDGDIVTISYGTNYLAVNGNNIARVQNNPTINCLWEVTVVNNQYAFKNVGNSSRYLRVNATYKNTGANKGWTITLQTTDVTNSRSLFTLQNEKLYYTATATSGQNKANCYIRYNTNWTCSTNANATGTDLTIEKWELKSEKGEVKITATANPSTITFDEFVDDDTAESKDITVTVSSASTKEKEYYQNLNNSSQTILVSEKNVVGDSFEISGVSATWSSNNNNNSIYSSTNCEVFGESASTRHNLLKIESVTPGADNKSCTISISTVGNSPMEMKEGEKWKDYSDILVVAFRNADPNIDATYRGYFNITRYSFHKEELPEFEVEIKPSTIEFSREGNTTTVNVSCTHQHGYTIRHMHGNVSDNTSDQTLDPIITIQETLNANPYFVTFTAKKIEDETQSDWLKVESLVDGVLTLSAPVNSTTQRHARLVGVFNYTNPEDDTDNHVKTEVLTVTQHIKDGSMILLPNKGHSGEDFAKNPFTGDDEQQVHTVEKTIYYTPNQAQIELRLAETAFRGYMRWYDYQTGCNPASNKIEADRTSWATAPRANNTNFIEINPPTPGTANSYGHSYGLYFTNNRGTITNPNVPVLEGWADGSKTHTIACDVSAHKDYKIGTDTIIEPTLSYRQLFHLRPATEMADKFKAAAQKTDGSQFLENYEYTAPSGKTVMLSTQFRYKSFTQPRNSHSSEFCYYYYKNGTSGELGQVGVTTGVTAKWYKVNGATLEEVEEPTYPTFDYLQIAGQAANTEAEYQLIVSGVHGGKDLKIARFVVKFVDIDTHGPVNSIMSQADIAARYQILEYNDFSFGAAAPGTGNMTHLYKHLPWGESTYGYFYPTNVANECDRQNTDIPYYGEYALMNYYSKSWAGGAQHGGAEKGYALFVDGTTEPGLVASISTDADICSGQTLYCSLWLMNPRKSNQGGTPPVFRCNIQGRLAGDTEWKDVGVYYVGALANNDQNWKQVVFPVNSDISYEETRVSVYNFGTDGNGNDFFMDDLCLFVSPLSLAAYQATMGCHSYTGVAEASTAVVVRVDYARLNQDLQNRFVYYRLFNTTDNKVVKLKTLSANNEVVSAYYAEDSEHISEEYGSVQIPADDYIPTTGAGDNIQTSLASYMDNLMTKNLRHGKCYVKDANNNWYLYLMHIIPNTQSNVYGQDEDIYLVKDKDYLLAIANDYNELDKPECASTTELHATTDTYVELHDADGGVERVDCRDELCANNQYFLDVKVQNTLATGIGGNLETLVATVHADWLIGEQSDDVYCTPRSMTSEDKAIADEAFYTAYRCTRNDLRKAIGAMRQVPTNEVPNPNYRVADANELVETSFFDDKDLKLIQGLCNEGKLSLYQTSVRFYMGSAETVRYWVYPIAEDATVTFNDTAYTLYDCDEPKWIKLTSNYSEYALNLSPINKENQTSAQRLDIPSVRILEGTEQVTVPIKQLIGDAKLNSALAPTSDEITFRYDAVVPGVLEHIEFLENRIAIVDAPEQLEPGKDYLMRMAFYNADGQAYDADCRVGFAYFYLSIVPKKVEWTGQFNNDWGDDRNWQGVKEDGSLMEGYAYAPLPETNVIIRADKPVPTITATDAYPMDVNHHPNACNKIYFEPGAMIHNQHLLEYNEAYVDMKIQAANWNSMAPPLKGMYTGDMYVPHNGMYDGTTDGKNAEYNNVDNHSDYPFVVNSFQGTRTSKAPYVFWQSVYNKSATVYHANGNQKHYPASSDTETFVQTNSLGQALPVGSGYQVLGYGPTHKENDEIIVRLPKPDEYYSYYYNTGAVSEQRAYVDHSSSHRLAFEPDASGNMRITLKNDLASNKFMFGNPTMNDIDMAEFLASNTHISAYYQMENSSWQVGNSLTAGTLAPMRSVLLVLKEDAKTSITVTLSASHLVGDETPDQNAPARKQVVSEEPIETQLMTIYASCENGQARCMLASNAYAHDIYNGNEDALFISSGVEEGVNSATATSPINMYTVSEQVPMMVDVRENIDTVPLSMLVHDSYRTEKVQFAFYLSLNWDKECYFCDAVTGKRYRIMDGLWLEMDMPQNHEVRYFIDGPDVIDPDNGGDIWSSTEDVKTSDMQVWAYSPSQGELVVASNDIIKEVTVYDIAGRVIAHQTLDMQYSSMTITTIPGVCIVETTLRDNTKHYTQTVVR